MSIGNRASKLPAIRNGKSLNDESLKEFNVQQSIVLFKMGILPRSSYYDKHYRQSAALIRARQPYLVRNITTGLCLCAFTIGVYSWTINAVAQDDFSDVPIPDAPSQSAHTPHTGVEKAASEMALEQRREETRARA